MSVETEKETGRIVEQIEALPEAVEEGQDKDVNPMISATAMEYEAPEEGLSSWVHWQTDKVRLMPEQEGGEKKTDSGLFVNAAALPIGVVVEPERLAGRRVLYRQYHGDKVVLDGQAYIIIDPEYVLMFLKDDTKVEEVESA